MDIFCLLLAYKFIKGTFSFEKVTRFELIIIPGYSAIMMLLSLKSIHSLSSFALAIILLLVGILIGFLQTSKTEIKDMNEFDSHHRPILKIKRSWPYLIGWLISFAIGISVEVFYGSHLNIEEVSHELFVEILKDLSVIALLHGNSTWYVWLLNVATSFTYGGCLLKRYPKIRAAVQRKKKVD